MLDPDENVAAIDYILRFKEAKVAPKSNAEIILKLLAKKGLNMVEVPLKSDKGATYAISGSFQTLLELAEKVRG